MWNRRSLVGTVALFAVGERKLSAVIPDIASGAYVPLAEFMQDLCRNYEFTFSCFELVELVVTTRT